MNKPKSFSFFYALTTVITSSLGSCASEEFVLQTENSRNGQIPVTTVVPPDQLELNRIARVLANEGKDIITVKDAEIVSLTDVKGGFHAISFTYQCDGNVVSMIVPVSKVSSAKDSDVRVSAEGCVMKFYGKQEFDYEIAERCKTLVAHGAGNSTSVSFTNLAEVP